MKTAIPLAAWRLHRGLTQVELAALSGVTARTIVRIEVEPPRRWHPGTLKRLAMALETTVAGLYFPPS